MPQRSESPPRRGAGFADDWRVVGWLSLAVLLLVQLAGLYTDAGAGPEGIPGMDKVGHALMFGAPAAVARLMRLPAVVVGLLVHAVVSEPLQAVLAAGRSSEVGDLVADLTGIALAVLAVDGWRARRAR